MPGTSNKQIKKLATVSAIFMSVTASPEADSLQCIPCIHYLVQFQGSQVGEIRALINSDSQVNAMIPAFATKLGLSIRLTGIGAQTIDDSALKTYGIIIAGFLI